MFYHVFSTKTNPGGASIHRKKDLFPLKPPLAGMPNPVRLLSKKTNPGGASIHRKKNLFPVKPPLEECMCDAD